MPEGNSSDEVAAKSSERRIRAHSEGTAASGPGALGRYR